LDIELPRWPQPQICYESTEQGKVQIEIFDMRGEISETQILNSQKDTDLKTIPVTYFPAGLYLFRLQNSNKP